MSKSQSVSIIGRLSTDAAFPRSVRRAISLALLLSCPAYAPASAERSDAAKTITVRLSPETLVNVPVGYRLKDARCKRFTGRDFIMSIHALRFEQGMAAQVEFTPLKLKKFPDNYSIEMSFNGAKVPLAARPWGFRGLFALSPWLAPGEKSVRVTTGTGKARHESEFRLHVRKTDFVVQKGSMALGRYSDKNHLHRRPDLTAMIQANRKKINQAFSRFGPDLLSGKMCHPRDVHRITSPFYAKRVTSRYVIKKGRKSFLPPGTSRHGGSDLWGRVGHPIRALARGRVVIAEKMYYQGYYTVIDHGQGVFSSYMHQNKIMVREGEIVEACRIIGEVGKTGMVTGPHLHLVLSVRGAILDPLSLLALPIRD